MKQPRPGCSVIHGLFLVAVLAFQHVPTEAFIALTQHKSRPPTTTTIRSRNIVALFQANQNDNPREKKLGKKEGVYSRPSAAIERGSGFFIPGLEGPKIRIAVGVVLLSATLVNHFLSAAPPSSENSTAAGNTLAEGLAIVYSILVLLQAGVEAVQELQSRIQIGSKPSQASDASVIAATTSITTTSTTAEAWSSSAPSDVSWRERVEWSARTLLALTAATRILLVGPSGVVYRLGENLASSTSEDKAIQALQETLQESPSGRVALPPMHPASQAWASGQDCIVVQRIGDRSSSSWAWMVTSPETLAATLTQRDLQWLGPLARHVLPCGIQ